MNSRSSHRIGETILPTRTYASFGISSLSQAAHDVIGKEDATSLIIGTHTKIPLIGDKVLHSNFKPENRNLIVDEPLEVLEHLRLLMNNRYRYYDCIMVAFETHHFCGNELYDLIELSNMLCRGVTIFADYAFRGIDAEIARKQSSSGVEKIQQELYGGFERWLPDHAVYTPESFDMTIRRGGWQSMQTVAFFQNKIATVASATLEESAIKKIIDTASI